MESLQMQLLHLLQEDCRLPLEKLAVMTNATVETVATVIDDMERNGIILRYRGRRRAQPPGARPAPDPTGGAHPRPPHGL